MHGYLSLVCRFFLLVCALCALTPSTSQAVVTDVRFVGNVGYTYVGSTAALTADKVQNFSVGGFSGTLRMELWAFPSPFTGSFQLGFKLAQYTLGQLNGGFFYSGINSGPVP